MLAKRPPPAPAQLQSATEQVQQPRTPLKRVPWTLAGRLERGVDLPEQLANIHEALPLLRCWRLHSKEQGAVQPSCG